MSNIPPCEHVVSAYRAMLAAGVKIGWFVADDGPFLACKACCDEWSMDRIDAVTDGPPKTLVGSPAPRERTVGRLSYGGTITVEADSRESADKAAGELEQLAKELREWGETLTTTKEKEKE